MDAQQLKDVLDLHRKWVLGEATGKQADLSSADLSYANLSYANLSYANLSYADLSSANLSYANLSYADLSYANLSYADLSYADLSYANLSYANLSSADLSSADLSSADLRSANHKAIRDDFYAVLELAKSEVPGLYKALVDGKINGSQYQGECACLVGTIANLKHMNFQEIQGLKPDSSRLAEKWFLGISQGDIPQINPISEVTKVWMEDWMKKNEVVIPVRTVSWS